MQKIILLLCAAASMALLGGCQGGDDGAPVDPNAAQATSGGTGDPVQNQENQPQGASDPSGTSSTTTPEAGLNPNAKLPGK